METPEQHFAEDPERLEDFVLGRMDPAARTLCEQHLRACDTCRQAVHVEEIIAAGIKREGRERLKERIGTLAGVPPRRQIPWPHVLSVAALLLVLVGVGIYRGWFATQHVEPEDIAALDRPRVEGKVEQTVPRGQNEAAPSPRASTRAAEPPARIPDAEHTARPEESNAKGRDEKLGYAPSPTDRIEESEAAGSKDLRKVDIPRPSVFTGGGEQGFWANGTLMAETESKKEADRGDASKAILNKTTRAADVSRSRTDSFGRITVEQRPVSNLPASLQSQQQLYNRQTIQTLVRQSEGETQLTLYPESPFDTTQLHYARVQQVAPDSLVVRIGSQRIEYKLPAEMLRQGQTETSKAKRR